MLPFTSALEKRVNANLQAVGESVATKLVATWLWLGFCLSPSSITIKDLSKHVSLLVNPSGQAVKIKRAIIFLSFAFICPQGTREKTFHFGSLESFHL